MHHLIDLMIHSMMHLYKAMLAPTYEENPGASAESHFSPGSEALDP